MTTELAACIVSGCAVLITGIFKAPWRRGCNNGVSQKLWEERSGNLEKRMDQMQGDIDEVRTDIKTLLMRG